MVSVFRSHGTPGGPTLTAVRSTLPMTPLRTSSQATRNSREERCIEPVCKMALFFFTALITSTDSWTLWVSGFSQ